jgi:hypothetical protein
MTQATRTQDARRRVNGGSQPGPNTDLLRLRAISAEGRSGSVHFQLQRVAGGLYVEREDIPRRGLRTVQSIAFGNRTSFEQWCDGDPLRFEYPLLHDQLKRVGDELWNTAPRADVD